jgi:hypothetical protein
MLSRETSWLRKPARGQSAFHRFSRGHRGGLWWCGGSRAGTQILRSIFVGRTGGELFRPLSEKRPHTKRSGRERVNVVAFEKRLPHGLRSEPPNLDVVIRGSDVLVAIESKCTEYLRGKRGEFKPAYDPLVEKMEAGWRAVFQIIREQPDHFGGLDAAQLVDRRVSQPK